MAVRHNSRELLYNYIDEDFQKLLRPLNFVPTIYFYPKYKIRDNFITSNGRGVKFLSFCATLSYLVIACYHNIFGDIETSQNAGIQKAIQLSNYFGFANSCLGFIINFINCALYSDHNVDLVLKFLDIYKLLSCNRYQLQKNILINWLSTAVLLVIDIIICVVFLCIVKNIKTYEMVSYLIYLCFDFNISYAICIVYLMRNTVVLWNLTVRGRDEFCWKTIFNAYTNILEAYALYQKVYQTHILYYLIETFTLSLVYFQMWLFISKTPMEGAQYNELVLSTFGLVAVWFIKNMCVHIALNTEFEKLYIAINDAQSYLIGFDKFNDLSTASERKARKNILRVNKVAFSKMKMCGLFTMDATLPLRLCYTITAYMFVQLQFTLQLDKTE